MKARDGNAIEQYMVKVNPSMQLELCQDSKECFVGNYPTLGLLKTAYGNEAATMWLIPQLYNLSEYCGVKNKLEGTPLEECASIIGNTYGYLKTSELMLFFYRFKQGRYGRFYGNVDPMIITSSLIEFCRERNEFYNKQEQEERDRQREEDRKNAISYEEYCRRHKKSPNPMINELLNESK